MKVLKNSRSIYIEIEDLALNVLEVNNSANDKKSDCKTIKCLNKVIKIGS